MANNDIVPGFDDKTLEGMEIRLERVAGGDALLVVHLSGSIDFHNSGVFLRSLRRAIKAGFAGFIFDFSLFNRLQGSARCPSLSALQGHRACLSLRGCCKGLS